jgi:chromate transport protein ChrA
MLIIAWVYHDYGLHNKYVAATLKALQPAVAAMVFKAVHKLGVNSATVYNTNRRRRSAAAQ